MIPHLIIDEETVERHDPGVDFQRVGDAYTMLFESDRLATDPPHGDLRLAISDTGQQFRRVHPGSALVPSGDRGTWDENLLVTTTAGMLQVGDEIWIYYFGWAPLRAGELVQERWCAA